VSIWWGSVVTPTPPNPNPSTPPTPSDPQRATLQRIALYLQSIERQGDIMAGELKALQDQLASARTAMLQAMTLLDKLYQPEIDPAVLVSETGSTKTVTDALLAKVQKYSPAPPADSPPVVPSTTV
jgi:hypothetical protein